jgi:23S rRNA (cytidine1920-2'-O)/16S rRNA (cytidine1409-2'-O)-methyltransferase
MRLDKELVIRNFAPTRTKAQELIKNNFVLINGKIINKTGHELNDKDIIEIKTNDILKYVSRAGLKLEKAINTFNLNLQNKVVMDIGSSTGGFTDCALQNGANKVIAIDVGSNLMHSSLRNNHKIELYEQTNIIDFPSDKFKDIDIITIDVSFTSIKKIFEKIANEKSHVQIMALIKPQFECGKSIADKFKGIINSPSIHKEILLNIISFASTLNIHIQNLDYSPIKGGDGNIEYITLFSTTPKNNKDLNIEKIVKLAFENHTQ